jgi:DNA-binding GntR family transcriptional regulator
MRNLYEIRAMPDGPASRLAAERGVERARLEGSAYLDAGRAAVESGSLSEQIEADMRFHAFINNLSGNSLIGETTAPHWPYLRRVMGEVLREDVQMPQMILSEHVAILEAIMAGDGTQAETLSREHYACVSARTESSTQSTGTSNVATMYSTFVPLSQSNCMKMRSSVETIHLQCSSIFG